MNQSLRKSVGAVVLALATLAAVIFASLNFNQRARYETPYDGVAWWDSARGVEALQVAPDSPAEHAGIKAGDLVLALNGVEVHTMTQVSRRVWRAGLWTQVRYRLNRQGKEFETSLVTAPAPKPTPIEDYLRIVGLLYLFIGLFIFMRRWNAPRAIHFYIFCLVSFILYSFHFSGKLDAFDWIIYWSNVVATVLAPALLLHFALVFPERTESRMHSALKLFAVYGLPAVLLAVHLLVATNSLGFYAWPGSLLVLDQLELCFLGACFLMAGLIFYFSYRQATSGILRQQLKWLTSGTLAGTVPFLLLYILPFVAGATLHPWNTRSVLALMLIPLCYSYAIIRYRLMDVDIIFKRGLAYTAATAGVVGVYFLFIAIIGWLFHSAVPSGVAGEIIAIIVAAFLFQPFRDWTQARLDRFFYRDRLDYRRTLIEFGRTLTNEVRLDPMLGSVMDRLSQTLLVDRVAIFVEEGGPGGLRLARSMGIRSHSAPDLSFLRPDRLEFARGYLFYESPSAAREESETVRRTLEQLDLNYFIPCRIREHTVAVLGLGKTVDGDFLSSEDVELLFTIAGYVAIALDNAQLYSSLEQKAVQIERLKDFSENIVESLNVGVLAVDLDGCVESWNTQLENLIGVSRKDAVGRKLIEVLPPDLVAEIASVESREHVTGINKFRVYRDGKPIVVNVSITPLVSKTGDRIGRLILLDDVTQRERLHEQMVQNEKLTSLGLLAAGVAHEVNTPLAVISNHVQMLARQLPGDDPRHTLIDKIVKQTFRASEIVNSLLNFSRTGASEFVPVNLNQVVEETLTLAAHPFKTSRVNVIKNLQSELPSVLGSSNRLQQVFLNLFLNARDAMPGGGILEVRTSSQNGSVEVEITDTGGGIPQESVHRIFDPFFTTKGVGRGTGLGLSVSYGIIQEHAGKIDVRSTPGKGTSFHLEFPVARKAVHV